MIEDNNALNDSSFRNISKEEKLKYFNPLYLSSPLFKFSLLFFIVLLIGLLISIWFIKIDTIYLVSFLVLFQLVYIFLTMLIIKIVLKISIPNLSNKLFIKKHDLLPILKYKNGLFVLKESNNDNNDNNSTN